MSPSIRKVHLALAAVLIAIGLAFILKAPELNAAYVANATLNATASTYSVNATNGTVEVSSRGIYWQYVHRGGKQTWSDAYYYCDNLSLGNSTSWYLPAPQMLEHLRKDTNYLNIAPGDNHIDLTQMDWREGGYWTSSPGVAVQVLPTFQVISEDPVKFNHVRCVSY